MSCRTIDTKEEFYRLWKAGLLGNHIRSFDTFAELQKSGYHGLVTVRYKGASSKYCRYCIPVDKVDNVIDEFLADGAKREMFTFNETAPDDRLTMQGEYYHGSSRGYSLYCSTDQLPMRPALLKSGQQYYGLEAVGRMKAHCNYASYAMIEDLLDLYPESVIEFSCYSKNVGHIPGNNALIWEVRNY